jgi:hypothetical protein
MPSAMLSFPLSLSLSSSPLPTPPHPTLSLSSRAFTPARGPPGRQRCRCCGQRLLRIMPARPAGATAGAAASAAAVPPGRQRCRPLTTSGHYTAAGITAGTAASAAASGCAGGSARSATTTAPSSRAPPPPGRRKTRTRAAAAAGDPAAAVSAAPRDHRCAPWSLPKADSDRRPLGPGPVPWGPGRLARRAAGPLDSRRSGRNERGPRCPRRRPFRQVESA